MPNTKEDEVIHKLRERLARGNLDGIDLTYRVTGGAPGEHPVDDEIRMSGPGKVKARMRAPAAGPVEASEDVATPELTDILKELGEGVSELIPRSEASFIPDSIVGRVTLKVDGEEASFFFLPDEEQAKQHGKPLSANAAKSVAGLSRLHKRILHKG